MLGYLVYAFLLFLPGLALGLATRFFVQKRFVEVIAFSFGLSLIVSPIFLILSYVALHSIGWDNVLVLLLLSSGTILFFLWRNAIGLKRPNVSRLELCAMLLIILQVILLSLEFNKYPIFPGTQSEDFRIHLQTALSLNSGQFSVSQVTYPPGIHLLMASLLSVENAIPIANAQIALAIIATFAPLLVFVGVSRVLNDQRLGLISAIVYVVTGVVWYSALYSTGLYANFLADLVTITMICIVAEGFEGMTVGNGVLVIMGAFSLYLSHYSSVLFVIALLVLIPFVWWKTREHLRNYLEISGLAVLPGVLILVVRPDLFSSIASVLSLTGTGAGVIKASPDALANGLLVVSPFLSYMYQEIGIWLFVLTIIAIPVSIYVVWKKGQLWPAFIFVWLLTTWIAAPYGVIAWRFSALAVVPLLFLWPLVVQPLLPGVNTKGRILVRKSKLKGRSRERIRLFVVFVVVILLYYSSPIQRIMLQDLSADVSFAAVNQAHVYDAIQFLGTNGTKGAKVLGLEDWRFSYLSPLYGDDVAVYVNTNSTFAYSLMTQQGYQYVMVSYYLVPGPLTVFYGLNSNTQGFQSDSRFHLLYANPSVLIYSLNKTG